MRPSEVIRNDDPRWSQGTNLTTRTRTEESWIDITSLPSSSITSNQLPKSTASSQDEYEESESDSDQVMSSSNEDITDDKTEEVFTPQPNAFSHPPSTQVSYFSGTKDGSYRKTKTDHDAALRASLTTLLSCAAAVRPKPTTLRMIPESEISKPKQRKRKSRETSKERQSKKIRSIKPNTNDEINSTLATWMISAGVVLVFSAISFSAGYAWGKEMGRIECESCSKEALKGSRWSSTRVVS